jgi:hypothetical protein
MAIAGSGSGAIFFATSGSGAIFFKVALTALIIKLMNAECESQVLQFHILKCLYFPRRSSVHLAFCQISVYYV